MRALVLIFCLATAAFAGTDDARTILARALADRDPAGIEAALAADADGTAFRHTLRPRDYAALSRFSRESEAAREVLRRSSPEEFVTPATAPPADPRNLAPRLDAAESAADPNLRAHLYEEWRKLTALHPRVRGRRAADLWLELARDTFEGRTAPGGERPPEAWDGAFGPMPVEPWRIEFSLAAGAAARALAREPDLLEAQALLLRIRAAEALADRAMGEARGGSFSASSPPSADPAALALALGAAREGGEGEVRAFLLGLVGLGPGDPPEEELALALGDRDRLVSEAALAALQRLRIGSLADRPLGDAAVRALLDATRFGKAEVADAARQLLEGARLTDAQRDVVARSLSGAGAIAIPPGPKRAEPKIVKVFYGTDRAEKRPDRGVWVRRFLPAAIALLLAFLAPRLLRWLLHPRFRRLPRLAGVAFFLGAVVLVTSTIYDALRAEKRLERLGLEYGGEWGPFDDPDGPYCHFGTCEVGIPPDHQLGEVERPGLLTGDPWEDPEKHVMLLTIEPKEKDAFFSELAGKGRERAFVFVHGFNVTFEDAALRTAQIAFDLDFDGAPIFFSWPSRGQVMAYTVDENTVAWAARHVKEFLRDVRRTLPDATIHLVAHSMGNRALTEALRRLSREIQDERLPPFQEVVLAAPDIDAATFREDIAPAIRPASERITLYASRHDKALDASKRVHGYPRAGDADPSVVTAEGVQTVEVTLPGRDVLGHSYIGNEGRVLGDLVNLLLNRENPERRGLKLVVDGLRRFWRLE